MKTREPAIERLAANLAASVGAYHAGLSSVDYTRKTYVKDVGDYWYEMAEGLIFGVNGQAPQAGA